MTTDVKRQAVIFSAPFYVGNVGDTRLRQARPRKNSNRKKDASYCVHFSTLLVTEEIMAFSLSQVTQDSDAFNKEQYEFSKNTLKQAMGLTEEAATDAMWRQAQNNAMAKVKGMAKLAEAANQLS